MLTESVVIGGGLIASLLGLLIGMKHGSNAQIAAVVIIIMILPAIVYLAMIREAVIRIIPPGLKKFSRFLAWRLRLREAEPVKCRCNFCQSWFPLDQLKRYEGMQEGRKTEWLCCPICETEGFPSNAYCQWAPVIRRIEA